MYNVILADDDALTRTTLRSLIDWESEGFRITYDAANGKQAWDFLRNGGAADLLVTDMKMPVMDGLELMQQIQRTETPPFILALSGYDDFHLVRDAFRLGALDYILKTDITAQTLLVRIRKIKQTLDQQTAALPQKETEQRPAEKSLAELLADTLSGKNPLADSFFKAAERSGIPCARYAAAAFEMDNFMQELTRFSGDTNADLIQPVTEFSRQLPQTAKCVFASLSPSRYVLFCPLGTGQNALAPHSVTNVCRQLIHIWKNYLNLSFSCGICTDGHYNPADETSLLPERFDTAFTRLTMKYVLGQGSVFTDADDDKFPLAEAVSAANRYRGLYEGIRDMDNIKINRMREEIVTGLYLRELCEAKKECLFIIYQIAATLTEYNVAFWNIFQQDENYYQKIAKCESVRELEIWIINYLRLLLEYMERQYSRKQDDIMMRARQFIAEHYATPEISLASVAAYAGFSEKYFSTRFAKETGTTFSMYVTALRVEKAKELLVQTDFKTYEIAALAGYNSTEHFIRIFRKMTGAAPGEYRTAGRTERSGTPATKHSQ